MGTEHLHPPSLARRLRALGWATEEVSWVLRETFRMTTDEASRIIDEASGFMGRAG